MIPLPGVLCPRGDFMQPQSNLFTLSFHRDVLKMVSDTSEVKLRIRERYVVQVRKIFQTIVIIG